MERDLSMFVSCSKNLIYAAMSEPRDSGHCRYQTNTLLFGLDQLTSNSSAPEPDDHRTGRGRRQRSARRVACRGRRGDRRVLVLNSC